MASAWFGWCVVIITASLRARCGTTGPTQPIIPETATSAKTISAVSTGKSQRSPACRSKAPATTRSCIGRSGFRRGGEEGAVTA